MNSTLNYGLPTRDEIAAALQWAQDALRSEAIPDGDPYLALAGYFTQATQATAARLMDVKSEPVPLLPIDAMAKAIGTTTKNCKQHMEPIKRFLKDARLRSHTNLSDRKIPTGKPGRPADGFTKKEIDAVAQRVRDLGGLTKAFPIRRSAHQVPHRQMPEERKNFSSVNSRDRMT